MGHSQLTGWDGFSLAYYMKTAFCQRKGLQENRQRHYVLTWQKFSMVPCLTVVLFLSSSCRADVSSPVLWLKALFFSRCGLGCIVSLKTRLFLNGNKQPFSHCLALSPYNGWVSTGMHPPTPAQSTQLEVTVARPPTTVLIVEIVHSHVISNTSNTVRCSYLSRSRTDGEKTSDQATSEAFKPHKHRDTGSRRFGCCRKGCLGCNRLSASSFDWCGTFTFLAQEFQLW